ncbi:MAG: DUF305 domain-containing protein [Nocardioidaceae bacterium]|nr:DUF305 domain-containing protein [Nocardioidaceae bacterium]
MAIDMAEQAASQARHDEIKQLAQSIISAQAKMATVQQWQRSWGYDANCR